MAVNYSGPFLEATCENAELFAKSSLIHTIHYVQIVFSITTIIVIILKLPFKCFRSSRKMTIHKNLKIIIANAIVYYLMNAISNICVQLYQQIKYYTYSDPCDLRMPFWRCLILREGMTFAIVGFTWLHVVLCIERTIAILSPAKYEASGIKFGVISTLLLILSFFPWNFYILYGEDLNLIMPYCVLSTPTNSKRWIYEYIGLMAIDLIVLIIDIIITIKNRKFLKTRFVNMEFSHAGLGRSYQVYENARTMSVILPLTIAHSIIFCLYLASIIVLKQFVYDMEPITYWFLIECANTIPCIYTIVIPFIYEIIRRKLKSNEIKIIPKNAESNVYFNMFNNAIGAQAL